MEAKLILVILFIIVILVCIFYPQILTDITRDCRHPRNGTEQVECIQEGISTWSGVDITPTGKS